MTMPKRREPKYEYEFVNRPDPRLVLRAQMELLGWSEEEIRRGLEVAREQVEERLREQEEKGGRK